MKRLLIFIGPLLLAGCDFKMPHRDIQPDKEEIVRVKKAAKDKPSPSGSSSTKTDFPPVGKYYAGLEYSDSLQKDLDARNAKRKQSTAIMTLTEAYVGQDGSQITFKDEKGSVRTFAGWRDTSELPLLKDEDGDDYLDHGYEGKLFRVTWRLEAYWSDAGGEVTEAEIVQKLVPVK